MPGVLRGDHIAFFQDTQCAEGDILEVPDGRGYKVQGADGSRWGFH